MSLDELKIRCQHFAKLFNNNRNDSAFIQNKNDRIEQISYTSKLTNHKPFNLQKRPVYIQPNIIARVPMIQKTNGFYITTQPTTTTTKKPTTPVPLQHSIKYIRLEPVILQKTILNDGRTIYYWHRSLPTAVQYSTNKKLNNEDVRKHTKNSTELNKYDTTTSSTTSTTTTSSSSLSSSYYDFRNLFPSFYNARYEIPPTTSTTSSSTTTTTTTTPTTTKVQEQQNDELLYTHQLRFVVPVPYENSDKTTLKHPLDFDQFAYYPKVLQPSTINVQVPYTPTFQMIKTLTVPNIDYVNDGTVNQAEHKE